MQIEQMNRCREKIKGHHYHMALKPHCKQFKFAHKHFTKNSNTFCIDPHSFPLLVIEQISDPTVSVIQKEVNIHVDTIEISVDNRASIV